MRHPDWPELLAAFVEQRRHAPHAWGSNDCAMFAADGVWTLTGVDPFAAWRNTYSDRETAMAVLSGEGGFQAGCTRIFGQPVGVMQARRGDLLLGRLKPDDPEEGLAVCLGTHACAPGRRNFVRRDGRVMQVPGLAFLPVGQFRLAFRVD